MKILPLSLLSLCPELCEECDLSAMKIDDYVDGACEYLNISRPHFKMAPYLLYYYENGEMMACDQYFMDSRLKIWCSGCYFFLGHHEVYLSYFNPRNRLPATVKYRKWVVAHELRHAWQLEHGKPLSESDSESDADRFANSFYGGDTPIYSLRLPEFEEK